MRQIWDINETKIMYNSIMNNIKVKDILKNLTILYIEDEDVIRKNLTKTLDMIFKKVISSISAEEAIEKYNKYSPDLILSDINLLKISGIEFAKHIRKENYKIPIILLTAHTETNMLLEATRLKLVSYLTKPVDFKELYSSFENAVKEILINKHQLVKFQDGITYDVSSKLLQKSNKEIHLTSSEHRLLDIFIHKKDVTVTIEEIKNLLWDDPYDATESAFKSVLSKLRAKIGRTSIKNISGMGYILVAKWEVL